MGSNKNPRYDRVQAKDQIIQAEDLTPQAKVVGAPYMRPTERNVAAAPHDNAMLQLGHALSDLNPTITRATAYANDITDEHDVEQAKQFHMTATKLADGTRQGLIPPGKSQLFNDTVMSLDARTYANQYGPALQEAWAQNPDSTNPDKPNAFQEFSQKFQAQWLDDHNINADTGNQKFTPHQLALSKADEIMAGANEHLANHNAAVRIDELTKKGEDTLGRAISSAIVTGLKDMNGNPLPPDKVDYASIAKNGMAAITDQTTGLVTRGGLPWSSANKVAVTSFMQAAIGAKDTNFLTKIGPELDKLDPAHPITGTQLWKQNAQATNEHIVSVNFAEKQHKWQEDDRDAKGGDAAIYDRTKAETVNSDAKLHQEYVSRTAANTIFSAKDLLNPNPQELAARNEAMDGLRKVNAPLALKYDQEFRDMREHKIDRAFKDGDAEVNIYQAIEAAPGTWATNKMIDQMRFDRRIDQPTWIRLRNESKTLGQAGIDYKDILENKSYTMMEDGVKNSLIDPTKPFGQAALAAAEAAHTFRMESIDYLRRHPEVKSAAELAVAMRPRMKDIHEQFNETSKQLREQAEADQKEQDRITAKALAEGKTEKEVVAEEKEAPKRAERAAKAEAFRKSVQPPPTGEDAAFKQKEADTQKIADARTEKEAVREDDQRAFLRKQYEKQYPNKKQLEEVLDMLTSKQQDKGKK